MNYEKRTAAHWRRKWNLTILDADGWIDKDINEPISEHEFFLRAAKSTCTGNMSAFKEWENRIRESNAKTFEVSFIITTSKTANLDDCDVWDFVNHAITPAAARDGEMSMSHLKVSLLPQRCDS